MKEPAAEYLRMADLCEWLEPLGIKKRELQTYSAKGVITPVRINGDKSKPYYLKAEILEKIVEPFLKVQRSLSARACTTSNSRPATQPNHAATSPIRK